MLIAALVLLDLAVLVVFRDTENWRLGAYLLWWSPALLVIAGVAFFVGARKAGLPMWSRVTAVLVIVASLAFTYQLGLGTGGICSRPRVHAEQC